MQIMPLASNQASARGRDVNNVDALHRHRVVLEHLLLKPSMVVAGKEHAQPARVADVAAQTIRMLRRTVLAAVPCIFFLSGGQTPMKATARLDAINRLGPQPWVLSFSYGRALHEPALQAWKGQAVNMRNAQDALLERARLNRAAREGRYTAAMEAAARISPCSA